MSGILRLESLTKGNTLKQGDKTPLKYRLFDADGEKLNIAGKSAQVRLVYPDFLNIGYEKGGLTVAQDDTVTFTIDSVIPAKLYHVEIIVDNKFVFPSRSAESKFTIDKSTLGTDANIIEIVGKDALIREVKQQVDADLSGVVDKFNTDSANLMSELSNTYDDLLENGVLQTSINDKLADLETQYSPKLTEVTAQLAQTDNEIIQARGGEPTLGARLDETAMQVANTESKVKKLVVYPETYGAKGDGVTDDTIAFQNALNKGTKIIGDRDKTYFITQPLNVIFDNTEVDLRGAKIIYSHNQNAPHSVGRTGRINDVGIFNVKGEISASPHNIDTASDFRLDLGRVTLLDSGDLEVGDVVELVVTTGNNNVNTLTPNVNVLTKITETEGNVIKFDYFVPRETWDYSDYQIMHASVTKVNPLKNVVIKNFTTYDHTPLRNGFISGTVTQYPEADSHYAVGGIGVSRVENLRVENVSFNENMYNAIHALYVYNSSFSNIECYNPRLLAGGEGYLLQLMNYHKVWVDNLRASGVRHILDFTGGAYARAKDIFSYHSKQVPLTFHGAYDHNVEIDGLQGRTSGEGDRIAIGYGAGYNFGNAISDITFKNSYLLLGYSCDRSEKFAKNITFEGCNVQMARAPLQTIFNNCTVYMLRDTGDSPTNKRGSDVDSYLRFDNCEIINGYAAGKGIRQYTLERFEVVDINNSIIRDDFPRDDVRTTSFPVKNIKSFNVNNCRLYIAVRVYGNGTSGYGNTQYRFSNNEFHASRLGGVSLETIDGVPTTVVINGNTFSPREVEGVSIRLPTVAGWVVPLKLMITNNVAHAPFGKGADLNSNTNIEYVAANNIGLNGL